jgi:excinuclease ABC subunit A
MSEDQILKTISERFNGQPVNILAPVVKARKGHYRELFEQIRKQGFLKVWIDGAIADVEPKMQVDRYKIHDIDIVVDRLVISENDSKRLHTSIQQALKIAKGIIRIADKDNNVFYYSKYLMDPVSGISYDEPQPNTFSFNSPYGD